MLERVELPHRIAEPCAADGAIANLLRERGHDVITGDVDPDWDTDYPGLDFLSPKALEAYAGVDAIVSNPPFSIAPAVVRQALRIAPLVWFLLPLNWFEPCENRKVEAVQPGRIIVFQRCEHTDFTGGGGDSKTVMWRSWDEHMRIQTVEHVYREELRELAGQEALF